MRALNVRESDLPNSAEQEEIRSTIRQNWPDWLDSLDQQFRHIALAFSQRSKYWWFSDASRLNFLPWGPQPEVRKLLLSWATQDIKQKQQLGEFPSQGREECGELDYSKHVNKSARRRRNSVSSRSSFDYLHCIALFFSIFKDISFLAPLACTTFIRHVMVRPTPLPPLKSLIFCEAIEGNPGEGVNYLFGSVHRAILNSVKDNSIKTLCSTPRPRRGGSKTNRQEQITPESKYFWLLDYLSSKEFVQGLGELVVYSTNFFLTYCKLMRRAKSEEAKVLLEITRRENRLGNCFINLLVYLATKKILSISGAAQVVIQYEEKSRERAIITACEESGAQAVAYVCHPMDRALVALRDYEGDGKPKPARYGVCGPASRHNFCCWARKSPNKVTIWGSGKPGSPIPRSPVVEHGPFEILLLLSHPDELRVFHSWLKTESRLRIGTAYRIRRYSPVGYDPFKSPLDEVKRAFDFVSDTSGELGDAFRGASLTIYASTSAGLLASRYGVVAVQVDLSELIQISPCLDPSGPPLYCAEASELADLIDKIKGAPERELDRIYSAQVDYEKRIFAPLDEAQIKNDLASAGD